MLLLGQILLNPLSTGKAEHLDLWSYVLAKSQEHLPFPLKRLDKNGTPSKKTEIFFYPTPT